MQQAAVIETTSFSSLTLEWELQLGNSERVLSVKEREREREREGERERERENTTTTIRNQVSQNLYMKILPLSDLQTHMNTLKQTQT